MTPPLESRKFLWDAMRAADLVGVFVAGKTYQDYTADVLLRSAVERQLEIVGEALGQMARRDPDTARQIPEIGGIIGFRNVLAHGYSVVDDERVWQIVTEKIPALREALAGLLGDA
ncbi:MAG: DUF86 domain-containing protein [Chloroflexi bacterium]|nr:DUF86 domain-containing protein [Chloroflexota bacterium]